MNAGKIITTIGAVGLFAALSTQAAVVSYVGSQLDMESRLNDAGGWRNSATAKTLDRDSDNVIGTDGYQLFNGDGTSLPSYITSITQTAPAAFGPSGGYAVIDNPADPTGTDTTGTGTWYENGAPNADIQSMFTFQTTGSVPVDFRIALLWDNTDNSTGIANTQFGLTGAGGDSGFQTITTGNQILDWYYFDITGATSGETYTLSMQNNSGGAANFQVGGIAFDTPAAVPEPSSLALLILGGLGILTQRSRMTKKS